MDKYGLPVAGWMHGKAVVYRDDAQEVIKRIQSVMEEAVEALKEAHKLNTEMKKGYDESMKLIDELRQALRRVGINV
jgi:cellobiose-specific phosphotransferase system component IIA